MAYEPERYTVTRHWDIGDEEISEHEFLVLRAGDAMALGALWSYIGNINLVLELSQDSVGYLSPGEIEHLESLRDALYDKAYQWSIADKSVPS